LVLLLAVSSFGARNYQQDFVEFMHKHGKTYAHDEFYHRFAIFKANVDKYDAHNAKGLSYTLGVNKFSDLTGDEFSALYKGLNVPRIRVVKNTKTLSTVGVPTSIDWVAKGAVTDVKDQGQCGSCWSFSSTGSLEGLFFLNTGSLGGIEPDGTGDWTKEGFSEQNLVDCSQSYGNQGCDGGLMDDAFQYVAANGIDLEANYPYTAEDGSCSTSGKAYLQGISFTDVTPDDEDQLKAAVAQQPVSVAIEADQEVFQGYTGGVINDASCGTQLDHGVLVVGYGHDSASGLDYWKVKNSWSATWGMDGYVLIARGTGGAGMCGIASLPSYPTGK
jgi:C1A family cysteine protease